MAYRPKHFKVHCSIQNHRKTIGVYDDDALLAMYVRIGVMAIERFADRTGDSFLVSPRDLERLAGCRGVANARRKLGRLEATSPLTVCQEGAGYRLTVPNLRKKQGFQSEAVPKAVSKSTPSSTPTPTPTPTKERESVSDASRPRASRRSPQVSFPGAMTDETFAKLAERHSVDPSALRSYAEEWASEADRRYTANGWEAAINRALRNRWDWTRPLFGNPARGPTNPAQAKQDAIREAGRGALDILRREDAERERLRLVGGDT